MARRKRGTPARAILEVVDNIRSDEDGAGIDEHKSDPVDDGGDVTDTREDHYGQNEAEKGGVV